MVGTPVLQGPNEESLVKKLGDQEGPTSEVSNMKSSRISMILRST